MTTAALKEAPPTQNAESKGTRCSSAGACLPSGSGFPQRHAWTLAEFDRADEAGIFGSEAHLELIDGDLFQKMTQNSPHAVSITLAMQALYAFGTPSVHVRVQQPLSLGESRPEPDLSVVRGAPRDYAAAHPTGAELVLEISDSTLAFDRTTKQGLYAQAGIPEYWILSLNDRTLEVYRQPAATEGHPLGHRYRSMTTYSDAEEVAPLFALDREISVADLLP